MIATNGSAYMSSINSFSAASHMWLVGLSKSAVSVCHAGCRPYQHCQYATAPGHSLPVRSSAGHHHHPESGRSFLGSTPAKELGSMADLLRSAKKTKKRVDEGLEKVRAKPWAEPLGKALVTTSSFVNELFYTCTRVTDKWNRGVSKQYQCNPVREQWENEQ